MGYFRNKDSIIKVKPHPNAKLPDHSFNNFLYDALLSYNIKNYAK